MKDGEQDATRNVKSGPRKNVGGAVKKKRRRRQSQLTRADLRHHPLVSAATSLARRLGLWAWGHHLDEAIRALWRARLTAAFAIAIIGLSLATVGGFLLIAQNLSGLVERVSSLEISVYLDDDARPEQVQQLIDDLTAEPGVEAVRFVSRQDALRDFQLTNPELAAMADALGENPLPASLELSVAPQQRTADALSRFADRVEAMAGVDHVGRDLELAQRMSHASRVLQVIAGSLGSVLLLASLFTSAAIVKLSVYARRNEIEILHLIGATRGYVRGTFVAEGILQGLVGSGLALVILYMVYQLAGGWLGQTGLGGTLTTRFLSTRLALLLVGIGVTLGAVGAVVPFRRQERA